MSRSGLLRAAISSLLNEYRALDSIGAQCSAVFTITHSETKKPDFTHLLENFEDIIATEIHQHQNGRCLRVLVVSGDSGRARELFSYLRKRKDVGLVQVSIL